MADIVLRDLRLIGTSTNNGGRFGKVKVTGEAAINGDFQCVKLGVVGTMAVKGNASADAIKVTGEFKVTGNAAASRLGGTGDAEVSGSAKLETVDFSGHLRVGESCESERFDFRGAVSVEGLLNAESVNVRMFGPCRAGEVGGGTVSIRRSRTALLKLSSLNASEFRADLVEGDAIELEHTKAAVVRGTRVAIGPGCEIGRIEYRETLNVHKNATVGERIKL